MLAKLIAMASSITTPIAARGMSRSNSRSTLRRVITAQAASVLRRDRADLLQRFEHRRLILADVVADRGEQLLHLGEVLRRQRVDLAAHLGPGLLEALGELLLPFVGAHLGLV